MKKLSIAFLLLTFLFLTGCPDMQFKKPDQMLGVCRHEALYCASVYIEKYPVRIAVGPPGHAQSMAFLDNEWKWLNWSGQSCHVGSQEKFQPEFYYTVKDYLRVIEHSYQWNGE